MKHSNLQYTHDEERHEKTEDLRNKNKVDNDQFPKVTNETKRVRILSKMKMFINHDGSIVESKPISGFNRAKSNKWCFLN